MLLKLDSGRKRHEMEIIKKGNWTIQPINKPINTRRRRKVAFKNRTITIPQSLDSLKLGMEELENLILLIPEEMTLPDTILPIYKSSRLFGPLKSICNVPDHYAELNINKSKDRKSSNWNLPIHRNIRTVDNPKLTLQDLLVNEFTKDQKIHIAKKVLKCVESHLRCGICFGSLIHPAKENSEVNPVVVKHCLHAFCDGCIKKNIISSSNRCPLCRRRLASRRDLRSSPFLNCLIRIRKGCEALQEGHETSTKSNNHDSSFKRQRQEELKMLLIQIHQTSSLPPSLNQHPNIGSSKQNAGGNEGNQPSNGKQTQQNEGDGNQPDRKRNPRIDGGHEISRGPYSMNTVFVQFVMDPSDRGLVSKPFHILMNKNPGALQPRNGPNGMCYEVKADMRLSNLGVYCGTRLLLDSPVYFSVPGLMCLSKLYCAGNRKYNETLHDPSFPKSHHCPAMPTRAEIMSALQEYSSPLDPYMSLGDVVQELLSYGSLDDLQMKASENLEVNQIGVRLPIELGRVSSVPLVLNLRRSPFCTSGLDSTILAQIPPIAPLSAHMSVDLAKLSAEVEKAHKSQANNENVHTQAKV